MQLLFKIFTIIGLISKEYMKVFLMMSLVSLLLGLPVMGVYNLIMPMFGVAKIHFIQAWGLVFLSEILIKDKIKLSF